MIQRGKIHKKNEIHLFHFEAFENNSLIIAESDFDYFFVRENE